MVVIPPPDEMHATGKGRMSSTSSDRNLLFGILALQVNFISRDALIAGLNAWVLNKDRALADILVEQGALHVDNRGLLEPLMHRHLEVHGKDAQRSLAAIRSVGSVRNDLAVIADADVQASLASLASTPADSAAPPTRAPASEDSAAAPRTVPPTMAAAPAPVRYRRLREIARGGLGEVFVAIDEELHREVALKEIQDRFADQPDSRTRFLREAEITGKLEHPGVVPVYGLGAYADGRPFYAMRFIKGDSLKEAIERFHRNTEASSGQRALELRNLLGRFQDVCDAVAYAHSRGVLHRDLKPGNVMLGRYGETLVVDWGLAKVLGRGNEAAGVDDVPLTTTATADVTPTQAGKAIGTPQFMSPEQAAGRLDLLGPASDVYSLGATLFCLLTGEAPFPRPGEDGVGPLLCRVEQGAFPRPRQVNAEVSRSLEAICLKAMARRPQDRYATVEALGQDVQRWLAGEPVSAWPEPLAVKAGRWVRKNRVLATAAAAALLVAVVLGTGGGVYLQQQRDRAGKQAEMGLAQAADLREASRFADARALLGHVRGWTRQAGDRDLDSQLDQAEKDLALARDLDRVRQEAAALVRGQFGDQRMRADYPEVLARHGLDVLEGDLDELSRTIRASAATRDVVTALDDWAQAETDPARKQRLLKLANLADEQDVWRHAVRQALARGDGQRLRKLVQERGEGKPTPAVVRLLTAPFGRESAEATALLRRIQRQQPGDFWVSFILGYRLLSQQKYQEAAECSLVAVALRSNSCVAHYNLGVALHRLGQVDEASESYHRAIALAPGYAPAHANIGAALFDKGKLADAIDCCHRALAIDPRLASAHSTLGRALHGQGKVTEAIDCFKKAIRIDPQNVVDHYNLGLALRANRKVDEAIACFRKAITLDPRHAGAHSDLGLALQSRGKVEEALACYRTAIASDPGYFPAHMNLGAVLCDVKRDFDGAIDCFRKAIEIAPRNAAAHNSLGVALAGKGKGEEAIASYRRAIAFDPAFAQAHYNLGASLHHKGKLKEAVACFYQATALDRSFANAYAALGQALMQQGELMEAHKALHRCLELLPPGHPLREFFSRLLQRCQQLLGVNGKLNAFLAGKKAPTDLSSLVQMADLAQQPYKRLYVSAARLYRDAFARQPGLANVHRGNAACCAALAGTGHGNDPGSVGEMARATLRYSALCWLQDDLGAHASQVAHRQPGAAAQVRQTLLRWKMNSHLAAVRDPAALGQLPEAEQVAWHNLWAQVDALLARTTTDK
jgi:tetratricopeptide (TPR) repeat protein/serine/threonine protein kinase